jgi:hypothetical protein
MYEDAELALDDSQLYPPGPSVALDDSELYPPGPTVAFDGDDVMA